MFRWRADLLFRVCWGCKLITTFQPHPVQLLIDLLLPLLPLFDLGESLTQLSKFFLNGRLLTFRTDALKLPLIAMLALAESKGKVVVALERCAGGNCDER